MCEMNGQEILAAWYLGQVEESGGYIQLAKEWISTLNGFREKYQHNWRIIEACRELIFSYTRKIQEEAKEIDRLRKSISELSSV